MVTYPSVNPYTYYKPKPKEQMSIDPQRAWENISSNPYKPNPVTSGGGGSSRSSPPSSASLPMSSYSNVTPSAQVGMPDSYYRQNSYNPNTQPSPQPQSTTLPSSKNSRIPTIDLSGNGPIISMRDVNEPQAEGTQALRESTMSFALPVGLGTAGGKAAAFGEEYFASRANAIQYAARKAATKISRGLTSTEAVMLWDKYGQEGAKILANDGVTGLVKQAASGVSNTELLKAKGFAKSGIPGAINTVSSKLRLSSVSKITTALALPLSATMFALGTLSGWLQTGAMSQNEFEDGDMGMSIVIKDAVESNTPEGDALAKSMIEFRKYYQENRADWTGGPFSYLKNVGPEGKTGALTQVYDYYEKTIMQHEEDRAFESNYADGMSVSKKELEAYMARNPYSTLTKEINNQRSQLEEAQRFADQQELIRQGQEENRKANAEQYAYESQQYAQSQATQNVNSKKQELDPGSNLQFGLFQSKNSYVENPEQKKLRELIESGKATAADTAMYLFGVPYETLNDAQKKVVELWGK